MRQSDLRPFKGTAWRFVEDQNTSSTMKVVSSVADQETLEHLLDDSKPAVPAACRHLHYLLFTPFRYRARSATRFRRKGERLGVFYAAESVEVCGAEMAFYRLLFFLESPDTTPTQRPFEMTAFKVGLAATRSVRLAEAVPPTEMASYTDPVEYSACHRFVDEARKEAAEIIEYPSVRSPGGTNYAVLDCAVFEPTRPIDLQGWWFRITKDRVFAQRRFGVESMEFAFEDFASDPRIAERL